MNCCKKVMGAALAGLAMLAVTGAQAATSLADAKSKINEAVKNDALMEKTVKDLSAADQKTFVGEVNAAIDELPGSAASKTKAYVTANQAMLKGADKKNLKGMLAEVFATVPVEALPSLSESFAVNLFDRTASKVSDAQYEKIAKEIMKEVVGRVSKTDNTGVRAAFAAVMFEKASGDKPATLLDTLIKELPADVQKKASAEWLPGAKKGNYEAMLTAAGAEAVPAGDSESMTGVLVLRVARPMFLDLVGAEISGVPALEAVFNGDTYAQPLDGLDNEPALPEPIGYGNQW